MQRIPAVSVIRVTVRAKRTRTWYLAWRDPRSGKLIRQATGLTDRHAAKLKAADKARELAAQVVNGSVPLNGEIAWSSFVQEFQANYAQTKSAATAAAYEHKLRIFTRMMEPQLLRDVNRLMLQKFVALQCGTEKSKHTIDGYLRHLRTALNVAHAWNYVSSVVSFKGLFLARDEGERRVIAPEHLKAIITAIDLPKLQLIYCTRSWWRAFLRTLHFTGMRVGEALGLAWSEIDFAKRTIKVLGKTSKGGKSRTLPDCDELLTTLAGWRQESSGQPSDLVFPLPPGKSRRVIYDDWYSIQAAAGIGKPDQYDFQDFRSTCATELLEENVPTAIVKDWLGHAKSSTVLERYYANTLRALANVGKKRRVV